MPLSHENNQKIKYIIYDWFWWNMIWKWSKTIFKKTNIKTTLSPFNSHSPSMNSSIHHTLKWPPHTVLIPIILAFLEVFSHICPQFQMLWGCYSGTILLCLLDKMYTLLLREFLLRLLVLQDCYLDVLIIKRSWCCQLKQHNEGLFYLLYPWSLFLIH